MPIAVEHEIHRRRKGRNIGVGVCLGVLVAVLFGLSAVKVSGTGPVEGFDHVARPALEVRAAEEARGAAAGEAAR